MKTWWLKLYTIPSFIESCKWMAYFTAGDILVSRFAPDLLAEFFFLLPGLIAFSCFFFSHDFFEHFDFHKNSISFRTLQKIAIKEFFASFFLRMVLGSVVILVSYIAGGSGVFVLKAFHYVGTFSLFVMMLFGLMSTAAIFRIAKASPKVVAKVPRFHKNFFIHLLLFVFVGCSYLFLSGSIMVTAALAGSALGSMFIIMAIFFFTILFNSWFTPAKVLFHHTLKTEMKVKPLFKKSMTYTFVYLPLMTVFVFAFWPLARLDMQLPFYSHAQKYSTFQFWGNLSPEINEEEFISFARQTSSSDDLVLVYEKAPLHVRKFPLTTFIKKPSVSQATGYLMKADLNHQELRLIGQSLSHEGIKTAAEGTALAREIIKQWPKNEELPVAVSDYLLEHKKRQIASELPKIVE